MSSQTAPAPSTTAEVVQSTYPEPPAPYESVGCPRKDRLAFFHKIEKLKTQKRGGWVREGISAPESISDHMYRMGVLAMLLPKDGLDIGKAVQLALVHDLAEAHVGDITPLDGVSKAQKDKYEREAMQNFTRTMLGKSAQADRLEELWEEYEAGQTAEAKVVKDLDRLELCLQTIEYERSEEPALPPTTLAAFYRGSIPHIRHPVVREWTEDVCAERHELYVERGQGDEEKETMQGLTPGCKVPSS